MTLGLDTSVVLRLLTGEPPDQARRALSEVEAALRRGDALLTFEKAGARLSGVRVLGV